MGINSGFKGLKELQKMQ